MLQHLKISNYAIIDAAEIDFSGKLNIITGETGAGKSILLGALGLLLGERADAKVLFRKDKKCIVEGTFQIASYNLENFFEEENIDFSDETMIRRELSDNGKSRAFINDTPVTLQVLTRLADRLVTVHSQHETLALSESHFQLMVIDALAGTTDEVRLFSDNYAAWKKIKKDISGLEELQKRSLTEKDFIEFQYQELEKTPLDTIDQEELENELSKLTHAEEIIRSVLSVVHILENSESSLSGQLNTVLSQLQSVAEWKPDLKEYMERITSARIELKDISSDLEKIAGGISADPQRAEEIQQVLNAVYKLQKKHGLASIAELLAYRNALSAKLEDFETSDDSINRLKKEEEKQFGKLMIAAKKISRKRKEIIGDFEKQVRTLLAETGMKDAELKVAHDYDTEKYLSASGADAVQFLFSANKGGAPQDIKKVASGGELSRLMLCIKSLLAKSVALPTLIFDEIDSGVSGEVAGKVGNILLRLAENHQVIAITHLPQIAARGAHHLFVYKESEKTATQTHIRLLSKEQRISEIAKMLSGENPSPAAYRNAEELMQTV